MAWCTRVTIHGFITLLFMSSLVFILFEQRSDFGIRNQILNYAKDKNKALSILNSHFNVQSITVFNSLNEIQVTSIEKISHNKSIYGLDEENTKKIDVIKIGILIPSSCRRLKNISLEKLSLIKLCLPSLYKTLEQKFKYVIYIGIDKDDYLVKFKDKLEKFDHVKVVLSSGRTFTQAANTIAREAYVDGMDYLVRINDDSTFETTKWSSEGISVLQTYIPKNIGVVGPTCKEGNIKILTHDMVHRTHIEIFNYYYPPFFDNWWIDDWITEVYSPNRSTKLSTWVMKHYTNFHGTRYKVDMKKHAKLKKILKFDKERLSEYMLKFKQ